MDTAITKVGTIADVVDAAFDTVLSIMQSPAIGDGELALYLELIRVQLMHWSDFVDWDDDLRDKTRELFNEALISGGSLGKFAKFADEVVSEVEECHREGITRWPFGNREDLTRFIAKSKKQWDALCELGEVRR
jgi:hypothetical protein